MGRHASEDRRRRRPAAWLVIVVVAALVVAGLTVGYFIILNKDKGTTAGCTGSTVLPVTAAPGSANAVSDAAVAFNATKPVARSTCVSVSVTAMPGAAAAAALAGGWQHQQSPAPGLWVVDSAADVATLDAANSAMTAGHTNSDLATSPVVLAMAKAPAASVGSWQDVAGGRTGPVVAVPDPATNRASAYALESIAASGPVGGGGIDAAAVAAATPALLTLARSVPTPPTTTTAALAELAAGTSTFTAVPVVESDLAAFNAANSATLVASYPSGPTAGDDVLAVPITAGWVSDAMSDAAAAFDAYLGDPAGLAIIAKDGLRAAGTPSTPANGVDPSTKVNRLPDTSTQVRQALFQAWSSARSAAPPSTVDSADPSPSVSSTTAAPPTTTVSTGSTSSTSTTSTSTGTTTTSSTATSSTSRSTTPTPTTRPTTSTTSTTRTTPRTTPATSTTPQSAGPAVTLVLDTSGSMNTVQGGQQRISWMQSAVNSGVQKNPADSVGLWAFSTHEGSSGYAQKVPLGPLTESLGGATRASQLTSTVNGLTTGGNSWTYGAIRAAFTDAVASAVPGRPNRVVVLTDGADTTPGLSRDALKSAIAGLVAQNRGVTLDIIALSNEVNAQALTEIATSGGGTFTEVDNLADLQSVLLPLFS